MAENNYGLKKNRMLLIDFDEYSFVYVYSLRLWCKTQAWNQVVDY